MQKNSRYLSKPEMVSLVQQDTPNGEIMDLREIGAYFKAVPTIQVALSRDVAKADDHEWLSQDITTWRLHTFVDGKRTTSIIVDPQR